jgi:hypothetical protein
MSDPTQLFPAFGNAFLGGFFGLIGAVASMQFFKLEENHKRLGLLSMSNLIFVGIELSVMVLKMMK